MNKLRQRRMEAGLRQKDVAASIGVGPLTYHRFEDGTQEPKLSTLIKIALVLHCKVEDLIDDYNIN